MTETIIHTPSFNLWHEPWITVERSDGQLDMLTIRQTLAEASDIRTLYDPSPLVVVGIHRLLVAILQDSLRPKKVPDLVKIWREGQFSAEALQEFEANYAHRFDLFSKDAPFLQSADLSLVPNKKDNVKPVGYLHFEQTAGSMVTHYTHAYDESQQFCSICVAKGLLLIPAFASAGGQGIKPSINGVPPIYVLPGGETLFTSLAASLTIPKFQPGRSEVDQAWWAQSPIVKKKEIVKEVGYLHSLTFPARRVRLHPSLGNSPCTRCGQRTTWHVATMIYDMGQSRTKEAAWWRDPFAAYRQPKKEKEPTQPTPIRPVEGRAAWREFTGLFLPSQKSQKNLHLRPTILDQLEEEEVRDYLPYENTIPFRTISLRTDMKMKIFEWQESGFAVPPRLLRDEDTAKQIEESLHFAVKCDQILKGTFRQYFGGDGKSKHFEALNLQMSRRYWQELGQTFKAHIQGYTAQANTTALFKDWLQQVIHQAIATFEETSGLLPDDGASLALRVQANRHCRAKLYSYRKKTYPMEEDNDSTINP